MKLFICYDAGCSIWFVDPYNPSIEWHNSEYIGTFDECKAQQELNNEMIDKFLGSSDY